MQDRTRKKPLPQGTVPIDAETVATGFFDDVGSVDMEAVILEETEIEGVGDRVGDGRMGAEDIAMFVADRHLAFSMLDHNPVDSRQ